MKNVLFLICLFFYSNLFSQRILTENEAIDYTVKNHPQMQFSQQEIEQQKALKKGSINLPNPDVWTESPTALFYANGVQQTGITPWVYSQQYKVANKNIDLSEKGLVVSKNALIRDVKTAYLNLQYFEMRVSQLAYQDSIFNKLALVAERRYQAGDADLLEKINSQARSSEIRNLYMLAKNDLYNIQLQLRIITGIDEDIKTASGLIKINPNENIKIGDSVSSDDNPILQYYKQSIEVSRQMVKLERSKLSPAIMIGYLNQGFRQQDEVRNTNGSVSYAASDVRYRLRFGLSIPLWTWTYKSQIQSANIRLLKSNAQYSIQERTFNSSYQQAITDYTKYKESLAYFEETGIPQSNTIIDVSTRAYQAGSTNYIIYMQSLNQAFEIKVAYLDALRNYNNSVIQLNYLKGQL